MGHVIHFIESEASRVRKFSFLTRHCIKLQLYRYIYIVFFSKSVSELYWIVLIFLDPLGIVIVSLEDFQQKILSWSTFLPTLSIHTRKGRKEGAETMKTVYKFRSTRLEMLHKNICSENFGKFSRKHQWWVPAIIKLQGLWLY